MSISDPNMWRDMLGYLRKTHTDLCRQWFEELEPLNMDSGTLLIRVNNPVQQNYLSKRCTQQFNDAAQAVTGALVGVKFVLSGDIPARGASARQAEPPTITINTGSIAPGRVSTVSIGHSGASSSGIATATIAPPAPAHPAPQPAHHQNLDLGSDQIVLSPDYTFANFVTGPDNQLAYAASVAVAENPGKAYNPLFIHGGVGLGKTHLLQAICQTMLERNSAARIVYLSCDTFMTQFLDAVQNNQMAEFRHRYRHVDLLLIDDIHFLTNRERTQEEFFHTFNTLYQAGKQIVISSDSPPNEIPQLEERLVSRFNWGLVTRIDKPCYETRLAILRKKAQIRGVEIPEDVVCYIAEKRDSNTRELEGAINKIHYMSMQRSAPITMALAREALDDHLSPVAAAQLTIQHIIDAVTQFYGVKLSDLQSKRRHRSITVPRQVCMYLARKRTRYSLEEIGGYFGGRDHTTVMHAIKTTEDRIAMEPGFGQQIEQLDVTLGKAP